jgi:hypothetical protein
MSDNFSSHRSHISSKEASMRGWSRVPSPDERAETYNLGKEVGCEYMNSSYMVLSDGSNFNSNLNVSVGNSTGVASSATWTGLWTDSTKWTGYDVAPFDVGTFQPEVIPYPQYPQIQTQTIIREIIKEREVTKEVEKRSLFKVYLVDPRKNGKIIIDGKAVIAINENQAMLKAGLAEIAAKEDRELEDFDVYVQLIGTFIRPRTDIQRVKIEKAGND